MIYKLFLAEIKLTFRNKLTFFYFSISPITLVFLSYYLISIPENTTSYSIFNMVYLLPFISFMGSGLFCWYWGRLNYKFFFLKRGLKKLIISKILFIYTVQVISVFCSSLTFLYFEYYFYLKIILLSSINSLTFFTLFILWILSYNDDSIDLFDNQIFVIKQNMMNIVSLVFIIVLSTISYAIFNLYPFHTLTILFLSTNILLILLFKNRIISLIRKQLIKNSKIKTGLNG